ncbi:NED-8 protein [Aphelenchoides avenae]|nr:NED-8 protein [Aphelenchus avenae]
MQVTVNANIRKGTLDVDLFDITKRKFSRVKYETKVCINVPLAAGRQDAAHALNIATASLAGGKLAKLVEQAIEAAGLEPDAWDIGSIKLQVELEGRQLMKPGWKFQIATFTRKGVISLDVKSADRIERVKEKIEEEEVIPTPQQRLIFAGQQMSDEKTLAERGIKAGAVLHMVMARRGC